MQVRRTLWTGSKTQIKPVSQACVPGDCVNDRSVTKSAPGGCDGWKPLVFVLPWVSIETVTPGRLPMVPRMSSLYPSCESDHLVKRKVILPFCKWVMCFPKLAALSGCWLTSSIVCSGGRLHVLVFPLCYEQPPFEWISAARGTGEPCSQVECQEHVLQYSPGLCQRLMQKANAAAEAYRVAAAGNELRRR